jgi:ABC-2 type transport system ATP-binding protein
MSDYAIQTENLTKRFGARTAVDALSLSVSRGGVCGFLGVNGAGKTTVIRMLMGHLHPTAGVVRTLGADPWRHDPETRARIAYVSEEMRLPAWMSPVKAAAFNADLYPRWDAGLARALLDEFKLRDAGPFARLSKGQQRKTCILLALCQGAELVIMDEPAAGLDVVARHDFLNRVLDIACDGHRTVFISSHLLSDLERIVDSLAILDQGRAMLTGRLEDLKSGVRKLHLPVALTRQDLAACFDVVKHERPGPDETVATVADFSDEKLERLIATHPGIRTTRTFALNLEDIFVELVGADVEDTNTNTNREA